MSDGPNGVFPFRNTALSIDARLDDLMARLTTEQKLAQMSHRAPAIDELGVPAYNWWNEALHGIARAGSATVFPQAIAMAATFDPDLVGRVAAAVSVEGRAKFNAVYRLRGETEQYQGLTYWTPNVNIVRDPRWGRGQETWGEDPYLTATLASRYAMGLQYGATGTEREEPDYLMGAACAKHFAVHSGPEALRHEFDARVSPRDLWETYLPAFEALVDAGVEAVMGAYNRVNGEPACGSRTLLQDVLRDRWRFAGHVVSDCWAVRDFHTKHGVTATPAESAARAIGSGCDLNCGDTYPHAAAALEAALLSEEEIDRAARRVLRTRLRLGLLNRDEEIPYREITPETIAWDRHHELARLTAERACVLLKNDGGALPFDESVRSIYVTGPYATDVDALMGNYYGTGTRYVTVLEATARRAGHAIKVEYRPGCLPDRANANRSMWGASEAADADVAVVVMGQHPLSEGEEGDAIASPTRGDRERIELPEHHVEYLRELRRRGARIVLVLMGGSAAALAEVERLVDAILVAWYPGQAGGEAIARILFGDAAPSGRLPVSFPRATEDLPPFEDYRMGNRTYRFDDRALYPFGFGLSYGTVEYVGASLVGRIPSEYTDGSVAVPGACFDYVGGSGRCGTPFPDVSITIRVQLKNATTWDVTEPIQCYRSYGSDGRGPWALCGIHSVTVSAQTECAVEFSVHLRWLARVDEAGVLKLPEGDPIELAVGGVSPAYEDRVDAIAPTRRMRIAFHRAEEPRR